MRIPQYPEFESINLNMRAELHPRLSMLKDGVSEFTFSNLYLFRHTYNYKLSWLPNNTLVISGTKEGKSFFMLPCGLPDKETTDSLFAQHDFLKGLSESDTDASRIFLEENGYLVEEDRDNFDYLYLRSDLADLSGRKYHKKRNMVKGFINNHNYEEHPLCNHNVDDALSVLDRWIEGRDDKGDYEAAKEALLLKNELRLRGYIYYVDGVPSAYSLGEPLARGRSFAVHFEKAVGGFRGIYQFINQAFASCLAKHYIYVNREQDLGDPGLRHAKMSYKPSGFVKKYVIKKV